MGVFDDACLDGKGCVNTADPDSTEGLVNDTITDGHRVPGALFFDSRLCLGDL